MDTIKCIPIPEYGFPCSNCGVKMFAINYLHGILGYVSCPLCGKKWLIKSIGYKHNDMDEVFSYHFCFNCKILFDMVDTHAYNNISNILHAKLIKSFIPNKLILIGNIKKTYNILNQYLSVDLCRLILDFDREVIGMPVFYSIKHLKEFIDNMELKWVNTNKNVPYCSKAYCRPAYKY